MKFLSDPRAEIYWMEKRNVFEKVTNAHKQLGVYNAVSSSVLTQALKESQNNEPAATVNTPPRRAFPPLFGNIWTIWSDLLNVILTDDHEDQDIHEFSLEYLGIITLGNHIGNRQSREMYPKELVAETNKMMKPPVVDIFHNQLDYATSLDACHTLLLKNAPRVKNTRDPTLQFGFDCFVIFVTQVIKYKNLLSKQEAIHKMKSPKKAKIQVELPDLHDPNYYCRVCEQSYHTKKRYRQHLLGVHYIELNSGQERDPNRLAIVD